MFQFNGYILLLVLSGLVSAAVALMAFRRRPILGSREIGWLLVFVSFWAFTAAGEAATISLDSKITWSVISYLTTQSVPVLFLLAILAYTRQSHLLGPKRTLALFLIPFISIILAATNQFHRLLWSSVYLSVHPILGVIGRYEHGLWFWVEILYAYFLISWGAFTLFQGIFRFPYLFTLHHRILILTALGPSLVSVIYAFFPHLVLGTDMTPIAFTWTGIWMYWAIRRWNFLDYVPVARDNILESLQEGVLLFDLRGRLLEANQAAQNFFAIHQAARGQPAASLFGAYPQIMPFLSKVQPGQIDIQIGIDPQRVIQLNLIPLVNETKEIYGLLLTVIEVSEQRQFEKALKTSEERYRLLVENQQDGVCIVNSDEIFLFANHAAERIFGVAPGPLVGRNLLDFIPPDQLPILHEQVARRDQGEQATYEMEIARPDGARRVIEVTAARHDIDPDGQRASFAIVRDITERKQAENELIERERFLAMLNEITRAALQAADLETMLQVIADQIAGLFKSDGCFITLWDEVRNLTVPAAAFGIEHDTYTNDLTLPGEKTMTESVLNAGHALVADDVFNTPYISRSVVENYSTRSLLGLPLIAGGRKLGAVLVGYDTPHQFCAEEIAMGEQVAGQLALAVLKARLLRETTMVNSKLQDAMTTLDILATTDKLTGALNRHKFEELIRYIYKQLNRYHHPASLILFDVDHFKEINDTYGHHTGDQVLVEIADVVRRNIRDCDSLVRWGGDEFLILAPNIEHMQAVEMAEKIRGIVFTCHIAPVEHLTISVGVSELFPGESTEEPVRRADQALYQAKQHGRNRVCSNLTIIK